MPKVFDAIISVLNRASPEILRIDRDLNRLGVTNMRMTQNQKLFHLMHESGSHVRETYGEVGKSVGEIGGRIGEVLPVLGGLGAIGSVAGLVELVQRTSEASLNLQHMAITAGVTTQQLQALNYAGQQVGVSNEALATAMGRLNQRLGMAAAGGMKPLAGMLKHFNIALRDSHGHLRDAAQVMPQLVALFSGMKSPVEQNAVAFELFGRSYQDILPLLDVGAAKFQQLQQQFSMFGYTIKGADFENLKGFGDAWENLNASVGGVLTDVAVKLAPVLTPLLDQFSKLLANNKDLIAGDIAGTVTSVTTTLEGMPWKRIGQDMKDFGHDAKAVAKALGGVNTAGVILGGIIGISLTAKIVTATRAMYAFSASLALPVMKGVAVCGSALGMLVVDLVSLLPEMTSITRAWELLNLVMSANPLGVILVAVGLLIVGIYELWKHWKWVSGELSGLWKGIESDFNAAFGPMIKLLHEFNKLLPGPGDGTQDGFKSTILPDGRIYHPGLHGGSYSAPATGAGAAGVNGQVQVHVNFANTPPGTSVTTTTSGNVAKPQLRLGYNTMTGGSA